MPTRNCGTSPIACSVKRPPRVHRGSRTKAWTCSPAACPKSSRNCADWPASPRRPPRKGPYSPKSPTTANATPLTCIMTSIWPTAGPSLPGSSRAPAAIWSRIAANSRACAGPKLASKLCWVCAPSPKTMTGRPIGASFNNSVSSVCTGCQNLHQLHSKAKPWLIPNQRSKPLPRGSFNPASAF